MNAQTPPTPHANSVRDCPSSDCGFTTSDLVEKCPKCGTALQSESERRSGGALLMVMGAILAAMMALVITGLFGLAVVSFGGLLPSSTKINDPDQLFAALCVGVVWCFSLLGAGVAFFYAGRYQKETGMRDRSMVRIAIWLTFGGLGFSGLAIAFLRN